MGNKGLILTILLSGNFANDFIGEKKNQGQKDKEHIMLYLFKDVELS